MADFQERMKYLSQQVGTKQIKSECVVDQAYAKIQHENLSYRHPNGGRAKFLSGPLLERHQELLQHIANRTITEKGSDLGDAMIDTAESMGGFVQNNAPIDTGELYRSDNPRVLDKGVVTYDRPPEQPRLSEDDPRLGGQ